jgi:hypothetical protein
MGAAVIAGMLCGLLIGTLIGAVILRAACWLYNKMAGGPKSPSAVPEPEFGRAMLIVFVTAIVQMGVGFVLGLVIGGGAAATGQADNPSMRLLPSLIGLPLGFLVMAGMLTAMLPTTFPRALLVALLEYFVIIVIAVIIVVFFALIFGGAAVLNH